MMLGTNGQKVFLQIALASFVLGAPKPYFRSNLRQYHVGIHNNGTNENGTQKRDDKNGTIFFFRFQLL